MKQIRYLMILLLLTVGLTMMIVLTAVMALLSPAYLRTLTRA